jgi:hypothetical protein
MYYCGYVKESKGCDGEDAAAAFARAVAPVSAPSLSLYSCGGVDESKRFDGEEEADGDASATFLHAVAPMGASRSSDSARFGSQAR